MHLTNVAIQKTAPDYDPDKGCKWSLQQLRKYLTAKHGSKRIERMFDEMNEIFVKRLILVSFIIIILYVYTAYPSVNIGVHT